MIWTVQLTRTAVKQLRKLPLDTQQRIRKAIETLEKDPFAGDSKALKGAGWKGRYRKRVGRYRLIFILRPVAQMRQHNHEYLLKDSVSRRYTRLDKSFGGTISLTVSFLTPGKNSGDDNSSG